MSLNREIQAFVHGTENLYDDENINQDASSDAKNFYVQDGKLILIPGKLLIGQQGIVGSVTGGIFGYKTDGTTVQWRKIGAKIQYLNVSTWTDVVTGLTSSADYSFTNYSSQAGAFTYAIGVDGIYKMNNANPASFNTMYSATRNFKGKAFIDKGRMILWDIPNDKTTLRGSWIDTQVVGTQYTNVTGEATTSLTGTLAFKAGGATRNAFLVAITITASGEVYTDSYLGTLTGTLGGTGTINYMTGAYTLSNAGVGTATYTWEDSNIKGVTDFTQSTTRVAGEGFKVPQDEGGDPIINVVIGSNGYYSIKKTSAYRLLIDPTDLSITNLVYRKQMGILSYRGSLATSKGIIYMDTNNPEKPEMTILEPSLTSDSLIPKVIFASFKFANYLFDDCAIQTYERYIIVACKTLNATNNDTLLLCDIQTGTVSITGYMGRVFVNNAGVLYMGSSIAQSTYQLFSGFDDDGYSIDNYWVSKGETFGIHSRSLRYAAFATSLKKYRNIRIRGHISLNQSYQVYLSYDDAGFQLVGTVLGSGTYVDTTTPQTIGSNYIGQAQIGGDVITDIYPYFLQIRLKKIPKFRKRKVKFVAMGIGYMSVEYYMDNDITLYEQKLPARFLQKQNVSLDGLTTNLPAPQF